MRWEQQAQRNVSFALFFRVLVLYLSFRLRGRSRVIPRRRVAHTVSEIISLFDFLPDVAFHLGEEAALLLLPPGHFRSARRRAGDSSGTARNPSTKAMFTVMTKSGTTLSFSLLPRGDGGHRDNFKRGEQRNHGKMT